MRRALGRIWRVTRLAASGPRAWVGMVVFALLLGFIGVDLYLDVQMIAWTGRFYDAIERVDAGAAIRELAVFAGLVGCSAGLFLVRDYLRKRLWLGCRARLTDVTISTWTQADAFWHLRPGLSAETIDNPDQRVAEDCNTFVRLLLILTLDLVGKIAGVITYVAILWELSDFVLEFSLFGVGIAIPRYLVWLAFLYVLVSSLITHGIGRPLKSVYFRQERHEADFRHALVQLRDNAGEVAQGGGVPAERRRLALRFDAIRQNWHRLIRQELILGLFTRPYYQTVLRVPLFFALPAYFAGSVTFGGLMQLQRTFSSVTTTLSWFIFRYDELAQLNAVAQRLDDLIRISRDPAPAPGAPCAITRRDSTDGTLRVTGLRLATPQGRWLAAVPDRVIRPGDRLWITGASGQGKSTLVSALSGLWRYGTGRIEGLPQGALMVLPQRPHVFGTTLAEAACYPADPADIAPDRLCTVLTRLGLAHRLAAAGQGDAGLEGLSLGERQRLALARVLLNPPRCLILDEATSSLDPAAEAQVLALLRAALPGATLLCVAHRPPVALEPTGTWFIGDPPQTESPQAERKTG